MYVHGGYIDAENIGDNIPLRKSTQQRRQNVSFTDEQFESSAQGLHYIMRSRSLPAPKASSSKTKSKLMPSGVQLKPALRTYGNKGALIQCIDNARQITASSRHISYNTSTGYQAVPASC